MEYIASIYYEYGDRILYAPRAVEDDYVLSENDIKIDPVVYNKLTEDFATNYCLIYDTEKITSLDEIESLSATSSDKIKVAIFETVGDKKFLADVTLINPSQVTEEKHVILDRETYFFLSQFDLSKDKFSVPTDKTKIVISDLQKESRLSKVKASLESINTNNVMDLIQHYSSLVNRLLSERLDPFFALYFVNFIILNNYFASKGIFINDANRKEQYLKIANANDMEMLRNLSRYLVVYDKIKFYNEEYGCYIQFMEELRTSTSVEQIERLWSAYSGAFFSMGIKS